MILWLCLRCLHYIIFFLSRYEYQNRLVIHAHLLLNIKDGPSEEDKKLAYSTRVNKNAQAILSSMLEDDGETAENIESAREEL